MERTQRTLELAHPQRSAPADHQPVEPPAGHVPAAAGPALGATPARVVPVDRKALRERRVILPGTTDPAAHAYRMLRTQLLRQVRTHKLRVIGIASAADGEGKTVTAANLALCVAAEPNQTALLVDFDLRRPGVAELLGLGVESGLESWFDCSAPLGSLFVKLEGVERFRVLPTIRSMEGSSELLAETRTQELIAHLRNRYSDRLIIVDLPPVLLADDFLTVAPHLDCVLLVVSEGRTRREDVNRMKELLAGVRLSGTVLNRSAESEQRAY